jgi:hypothetical protein
MTTDDEDFRDLVRRMRTCQVEYFRTRSAGFLQQSKDLERRVDEALKPASQPDLFADNDHLDAGFRGDT